MVRHQLAPGIVVVSRPVDAERSVIVVQRRDDTGAWADVWAVGAVVQEEHGKGRWLTAPTYLHGEVDAVVEAWLAKLALLPA